MPGSFRPRLPQLDRDTKPFVIELLGMVGGSTALETVTALAQRS